MINAFRWRIKSIDVRYPRHLLALTLTLTVHYFASNNVISQLISNTISHCNLSKLIKHTSTFIEIE